MKKKIWIAVVVVLAILGIAGGIFYKNYRDKKIYEEKVNNAISTLNTYIGEFDNKENVSDKIKVVDELKKAYASFDKEVKEDKSVKDTFNKNCDTLYRNFNTYYNGKVSELKLDTTDETLTVDTINKTIESLNTLKDEINTNKDYIFEYETITTLIDEDINSYNSYVKVQMESKIKTLTDIDISSLSKDDLNSRITSFNEIINLINSTKLSDDEKNLLVESCNNSINECNTKIAEIEAKEKEEAEAAVRASEEQKKKESSSKKSNSSSSSSSYNSSSNSNSSSNNSSNDKNSSSSSNSSSNNSSKPVKKIAVESHVEGEGMVTFYAPNSINEAYAQGYGYLWVGTFYVDGVACVGWDCDNGLSFKADRYGNIISD